MPKKSTKPLATKAIIAKLAMVAGRSPTKKRAPKSWEPSARDLAWYELWATQMKGPNEIAAACEPPVSWQTAQHVIQQVDRWIRAQLLDEILTHRQRVARFYEHCAAKCLEEWNGEEASLKHLDMARHMMADLRKMLGLDKPTKEEVTVSSDDSTDGLERIAGKAHAEALREQAAKLLANAEDVEEMENGH